MINPMPTGEKLEIEQLGIISPWILTFPGAAIISAIFYFFARFTLGQFIPAAAVQV
jgi:hypothetical protein